MNVKKKNKSKITTKKVSYHKTLVDNSAKIEFTSEIFNKFYCQTKLSTNYTKTRNNKDYNNRKKQSKIKIATFRHQAKNCRIAPAAAFASR